MKEKPIQKETKPQEQKPKPEAKDDYWGPYGIRINGSPVISTWNSYL